MSGLRTGRTSQNPLEPRRRRAGNLMLVACLSGLALRSAPAGVVEDGFDAVQLNDTVWKAEVHGTLGPREGAVHLLSSSGVPTRLELASLLPNSVYGLRFDFRPDPDHQDGYAFVVQHGQEGSKSIYWYLEFMAGAQRVSGYRHVSQQWTHLGMADLTLAGKVNPFQTWYRVEIRNEPKQVNVRVFVRDTREEVWKLEAVHDDGPPAPLFFGANAGTPKVKPDLAGYIDNLYLAGRAVPGERLPMLTKEKQLLTLKGAKIRVVVDEQGRLFLFRPTARAPFGCVSPSAQAMGEPHLGVLTHSATRPQGQTAFTQEWTSETVGVRLRLQYSVPPKCPWIDVRMSLTNTEAREKQVRIGLHVVPTETMGEAARSITFRREWIVASEQIDAELDLLQPVQSIPWGTLVFCLSKDEIAGTTVFDPTTGGHIPGGKSKFELYLPVVSIYNERDGVVLFANPRAAFLFDVGLRGVAARHIFFLKGEQGFCDSGFFNGEADVDYTLHLGYPEQKDWGYLWRRYYCEANPWLRQGQKAPAGPLTGGMPDAKDPHSAERFVRLGTRYLSAGDIFHPEKDLQAAVRSITLAQRNGMSCLLWTNIRMAPAPPTFGWDPEMDYRKFEDSWIRGPDGKPQKCWDGYNCNPSPKLSLAKAEFERLTAWVQKYNIDGIFLDLYGDTTDVDPTRTYGHFPFYHLQVAEIEWVRLLADWCNNHGKILCLNCPHPSLMVTHLAGLLSGDTWGPFRHVSMVERMMAASAGRPHLLLGPFEKPEDHGSGEWLRCSLRAVFYGEMVCQWQPPPANLAEEARRDLRNVDWLFIRNLEMNKLLADSQLQGGDAFSAFWFNHPSGQGFITLNNETNFVQRAPVTLSRYVELPESKHYKVILWDLVCGPIVLAEGKGKELAHRTFQPALAPGQVKVLAFVNEATAGRLLSQVRKAEALLGEWRSGEEAGGAKKQR